MPAQAPIATAVPVVTLGAAAFWEQRRWRMLALAGCGLFLLMLRLHGLHLPLDSDEGEYGHTAQRLLAGDPLYVKVFDNKPPAIHFSYALGLWLFGDSDHAIRWVAILFSLASLSTVYACARQLFTTGTALWVALLFCLLNVEPHCHGHIAKIELFATPFLLGALAAALRYASTQRLRWLALAAVGVGVAASYKPWFALHVPLLMVLAWRGTWSARFGRWCVIIGAAILPCALWLGWLMATSNLAAARDALWTFNAQIAQTERTHANQFVHWLNQWFGLITNDALRSLLLPLWWAGIVCAVVLIVRRDTAQISGWRWLGIWTVIMLLEVTSGPRLSTYYFGPILPLVTMAVIGVARLATAKWRVGWYGLNVALGLLVTFHTARDYLALNNSQMLKAMWGYDFYLDFRELGEKLRPRVPRAERVYMWGFDTINFYSQRASGSRYFFMSPTGFDAYRMSELIDEVIRNRPMIFYENLSFPAMPAQLKQFVQREYEVVYQTKLFTLYLLKEKHAVWWEGVRRAQEVDRAAESRRFAP